VDDGLAGKTTETYANSVCLYAVASNTNQYRDQPSDINLGTEVYLRILLPGTVRIKLYVKVASVQDCLYTILTTQISPAALIITN